MKKIFLLPSIAPSFSSLLSFIAPTFMSGFKDKIKIGFSQNHIVSQAQWRVLFPIPDLKVGAMKSTKILFLLPLGTLCFCVKNLFSGKAAKFFLFVFFVLIRFSLISQNPKIDSLQNVLKNVKEDTVKINTLNVLSRELIEQGDYENAMQYANDALALVSLSFGEGRGEVLRKGQATTYNIIGIIYANQGNYDKALENFFASLKIEEEIGDKQGIASSYNNIGLIYNNQGNYDKALENHFASLKIKEEIGVEHPDDFWNKKGIAISYNNIGSIYDDQGNLSRQRGDTAKASRNYDKALENYFASLKIKEEIGDKKGIAISYNNIGIIYKDQCNYAQALENHFASLKIREEIGDQQGIAASYNNIGIIYYEQGKARPNPSQRERLFNKALENHFVSLKIKEEIGDKQGIASSYINIGEMNTELKKFAEAENWLHKGLELSKEIGAKDFTMNSYEVLSQLDSTLGNWKGAYQYHKLCSEIKDSIFNEESSKQMADMGAKYETEKKELQIENLNKDNAIKETEIKKQNLQKLAFAGGFGLTLILAFVIFRGYKQKQKANEIITAQKTEVEKQKEIVDEKNKSLEVAYKHIEEKNTEILDSIRYAKRIQEAILPPQKLVQQYLEQSFILYKPKDIVAGDFYWMHTPSQTPLSFGEGLGVRSGGEVLFASVDCTGHGVPGAFMSILGYNGLNRCVKEFGLTKPSEILDKLCELVDEAFSKSETDIKDGMDIALVNLTLNPSPMERDFSNAQTPLSPDSYRDGEGSGVRLQYAGAGNSLYLVRKINNETNNKQLSTINYQLTEFSPDKQPIGKFAYRHPFTNHEIELQKGDAVYIFTDGYADQFGGPKGKKFKYKQFEELLLSIQEKSMTEQREILNETIDGWRGELEQIDDICIIGVRV